MHVLPEEAGESDSWVQVSAQKQFNIGSLSSQQRPLEKINKIPSYISAQDVKYITSLDSVAQVENKGSKKHFDTEN